MTEPQQPWASLGDGMELGGRGQGLGGGGRAAIRVNSDAMTTLS